MHGEKMIVVSRITVVALAALLVFSSCGLAFASVEPVQQGDTTEYDPADCPLPLLGFDSGNALSTDTGNDLSKYSQSLDRGHSNLVEKLSGSSNGLAIPVWAVLFRYSRYDDSDPLENDVRQQIYDVIERSPGTYISEVSEEVDASRSTVRYHVRILEEEKLIVGEDVRGKHRFYLVGSDDPQLAAALNDDATARVLNAIARLESATVSMLADELDRSPGTVSYHLNRLTDDGLLEQERKGNAVVTRLASEIKAQMLRGSSSISPAKAD
ncbi:winged helix-turn-helix transcriptional regulator [Halocatena marina]|uniref:winged helix-turn-helix transcriptional regulator n=1 Tax=Halocatena marina TaxID=2934937 RepID=UPI00200FC695|nr:helix-turn-helix domain-containing protein [Halocatena marina]